ncbi:MAG TPA: YidC/Oxa1 family membrane protein insertase, partial [Gaiellaceae bacterium]
CGANFCRFCIEWICLIVSGTRIIRTTTVVVRMLLVPLTIRQIHSMQNLQKFAPQMKEIQKKYKHDRPKQNEELMKFYRENNINPAASCLPMLLQLPVFIALYYTLRNASFHGDLSFLHFIPSIAAHTTTHWGGYVLLFVYVASQMASSFFMMTTTDKTQRVLFMVMPVFFVFIIARFPAGLVLYWVTTNLWTVGQGLITRRLVARTPAPAVEKRSSRTPPKDDGSSGNGAQRESPSPKPAPSAAQRPRQVRRKKKRTSRR